MGDPSRARVIGPLQQYAPGFVAELARLGYTANSASGQMFVMAHLSRSFFRARSPDEMLATAAPWTSPWLPPGYEQNLWNAA